MFEKCCSIHSTKHYEIHHDPKPISFSEDMSNIIKNLLWYVPNIDSFQAPKNELIQDKLYDDFSFSYILNKMKMIEDRDVKWIEPSKNIDNKDWIFYQDEICLNCQKIVLSRCKSQSKTNNLLRCLRNCIAHGHFALVDNYIIGFNLQKTKSNPQGNKKAIIKIQPELLLSALRSLTAPQAKEDLFAYAFERLGYKVEKNNQTTIYDIMIEKGGRKHAINIVDYSKIPFIHKNHMDLILSHIKRIPADIERVLIIDTSRLTKAAKEYEKEITNFRIIDIDLIKEMLKDDPIDILDNKIAIE